MLKLSLFFILSLVIGFESGLYSVKEGQNLEVCIVLMSGEIRGTISVSLLGPFSEEGGDGEFIEGFEPLILIDEDIVPPSEPPDTVSRKEIY